MAISTSLWLYRAVYQGALTFSLKSINLLREFLPRQHSPASFGAAESPLSSLLSGRYRFLIVTYRLEQPRAVHSGAFIETSAVVKPCGPPQIHTTPLFSFPHLPHPLLLSNSASSRNHLWSSTSLLNLTTPPASKSLAYCIGPQSCLWVVCCRLRALWRTESCWYNAGDLH